MKRKAIFFSLACLLVVLFNGAFVDAFIEEEKAYASFNEFDEGIKELLSSEVKLFAVGDIMLDRGVEYMVWKKGDWDFKYPFLRISEDLKEADILFGNLEGPISDKGQRVGSIYSFRAEPEAIRGLEYAGFDILSLANNHMLDYQRIALEDTMRRLEEADISYVGAGEKEAFSLKIIEKKGVKVGFLGYTDLGTRNWRAGEGKTGMAWISLQDIEKIKGDISKAKKEVDVLVVSFHSGEEYFLLPSKTQVEFSKAFIDAGADIVLGHHPHVIQALERYKEGWVAYSLGNFVFDQSFSEKTMEGGLLEVVIRSGKIYKVTLREFKISDSYQPYFED